MEIRKIERYDQEKWIIAVYMPVMRAGTLVWECLAYDLIPPCRIWEIKQHQKYQNVLMNFTRDTTWALSEQEILEWIGENAQPDSGVDYRPNELIPEDYYAL